MTKSLVRMIDDVQCDVLHLSHLLDVLVEQVLETSQKNFNIDRLAALAWIARDRAEKALADLREITDGGSPDLYQSFVREAQEAPAQAGESHDLAAAVALGLKDPVALLAAVQAEKARREGGAA